MKEIIDKDIFATHENGYIGTVNEQNKIILDGTSKSVKINDILIYNSNNKITFYKSKINGNITIPTNDNSDKITLQPSVETKYEELKSHKMQPKKKYLALFIHKDGRNAGTVNGRANQYISDDVEALITLHHIVEVKDFKKVYMLSCSVSQSGKNDYNWQVIEEFDIQMVKMLGFEYNIDPFRTDYKSAYNGYFVLPDNFDKKIKVMINRKPRFFSNTGVHYALLNGNLAIAEQGEGDYKFIGVK